jgi:DUF971 family protein
MPADFNPLRITADSDGAPAQAPSDVGVPPDEVRLLRSKRLVEFAWGDQYVLRLSFAHLRRNCRCADCTARRRAALEIEVSDGIEILDINPIGTGAVQFIFSDGHDRGIFPWHYLRLLSQTPGSAPE